MKTNTIKTGLFVLLLTASFAITAQNRPPRGGGNPQEMFAKIDTDADGKLSREEVNASDAKPLQENFDTIDANGDGFLTHEELRAARENRDGQQKPKGKKGGKMLKELDTDEDGKLSKAEVDAGKIEKLKADFSKIDTNADGYLSKEELKAAHKNKAKKQVQED